MTFKAGPIDVSELYHTRTVLLLETGPGTNEYQQLALTKDEFEELEEFIAGCIFVGPCDEHHEDHEILRMCPDVVKLSPEIKDYYDEKGK